MTVDALLIELEDVLVEMRPARAHAVASAAAAADLGLTDAQVAALAGHRSIEAAVGEAFRIAAGGGPSRHDATDVELATLRARRALAESLDRVLVLVPGAREALATLGTRLRIGIVTRLPRDVAERVLARAELDATVACLVVAGDRAGDAPPETLYRQALARLARVRRLRPADAIACVADAASADAARAAGVRTIGVGAAAARAAGTDARLASIGGLTYDALVQLLARSGMGPT